MVRMLRVEAENLLCVVEGRVDLAHHTLRKGIPMAIDALNSIVAVLLSISLAAERLVTILKTLFPVWLADEKKNKAGEIDLVQDKWRRFALQILAFVASWITAAFLADGGYNLFGFLKLGAGANATSIPVIVVGFLASGGSAFWSGLLGYTKAVKDARNIKAARERMEYKHRARELNLM